MPTHLCQKLPWIQGVSLPPLIDRQRVGTFSINPTKSELFDLVKTRREAGSVSVWSAGSYCLPCRRNWNIGVLEKWSDEIRTQPSITPLPNPLKPAICRRDVDRCKMLLVFVEVGKPHGHAFGQKVVASFGTIA